MCVPVPIVIGVLRPVLQPVAHHAVALRFGFSQSVVVKFAGEVPDTGGIPPEPQGTTESAIHTGLSALDPWLSIFVPMNELRMHMDSPTS
jgi:hypothetical protein